ncbi:MAG: phosphoenolpyruvate carboxykinase [Pseudomonadota bacterium]
MTAVNPEINHELAHMHLPTEDLVKMAVERGEGVLAANHALSVTTGKRTGRSPKDRFIVKESTTEQEIDWGQVNQPIDEATFAKLWHKSIDYIGHREHFVDALYVGADPQLNLSVKVITETAWHNLFARQLFIRPAHTDVEHRHDWTILSVPNLHPDPAKDDVNSDGCVIINFKAQRVLIMGIAYAGEMKKAMFSVMNFLMPKHNVLPMHCSANVGKQNDVALFFGLSGTGKTTLSADPDRFLIGDDEHGWGEQGIFNFEGGCYAKCINLSQANEPVIWNAIQRGAVMENVILDPNSKIPDYSDNRLTDNTRVAYPRDYIEMRIAENKAGQPKAVIFLTCDLYGVLPPVAKLTKEQAAYHFLSGYTALVGSTEVGQAPGVKPTFSTCFGAPFFPRPPHVYADLLMRRIDASGVDVYLVNTGWTGGPYGVGHRFPIATTRTVVHAILNGAIKAASFKTLPTFNLSVPEQLAGVATELLDPQQTWQDKSAFAAKLQELADKFVKNFKRFEVSESIRNAGPDIVGK